MKFLKLFNTSQNYNNYKKSFDFITPNISVCKDNINQIYFNLKDNRLIAKYTLSDKGTYTIWSGYENNVFKSIEIDENKLNSVVNTYIFDTNGEHIIKYELYDNTKIGTYAPVFLNSLITDVIVPNTVINLNPNTFLNCVNLKNVILGKNVKYIGSQAFNGCVSLEEIIIPNSVITIDDNSFYGCSALSNIVIGNHVEHIGNVAFYKTNIETLNIPDNVKQINKVAFGNCQNLKTVTFGSGIELLEEQIFSDCYNLENFTIKAINPPTFNTHGNDLGMFGTHSNNQIIKYCNDNLKIYVPAESINTYKSASGWSEYAEKIYAIE